MTEPGNGSGPGEELTEPPCRERSLSREGDSLYTLLNISKDATDEEIKKAYRKMALRHHPDKNPDDPSAAERFKEVNRAHTVLRNPTKRRIYDKYGSVGLQTADQVGDEMAEVLLKIDTWWCKGLFCFCGIITVCYFCCCFCCCCNCCCGKCRPDVDEEFPVPDEDEEGGAPITTQPTSQGNSSGAMVMGPPGGEAIALGPASGGDAPIALGPPAEATVPDSTNEEASGSS